MPELEGTRPTAANIASVEGLGLTEHGRERLVPGVVELFFGLLDPLRVVEKSLRD